MSPACFRLSYDDDLRHLTGQAFRQGMISRLVRVSSCGGWFCLRDEMLVVAVVVPWSHQQLQHVRDRRVAALPAAVAHKACAAIYCNQRLDIFPFSLVVN